MSIHVQARGFELTESLERHVHKRINADLGHRLDDISSLRVGLSDINGPRGGADKCCRVHIGLPRQPDLVINDVQADMYNAIDSALRRARRALRRRLSRLRAGARRRIGWSGITAGTAGGV